MAKFRNQKLQVEVKSSILDSVNIIVFTLGLPALAITYLNIVPIGHFPYISALSLLILLLFIILRKKINYLIKGWGLIIMGYLIGTTALWNEGILSDGLLYYVGIGIAASMLINIRSGLIISLVSVATFSVITWKVSTGSHTYDFDIIKYFYSPKTWLAFIFTAVLFSGFALYIYGRLEFYLVEYINKLRQQSIILSRSKKSLENEIIKKELKEVQLRESENKFKKVFNSIGDGILLLHRDNTVHDVNESFLEMSGLAGHEVTGRLLESFFVDPNRIDLLLKQNTDATFLFNLTEHWLKMKSGSGTLPVEVRILPIRHETEINSIALIKDISSKKETDSKIMQAAINGEEEERKRIAQDLHDSIGPYLSTAKLYINSGALSVKDSRGAEIKKELGDILNLAISSVREISGNLGSYVLRSAGLYTALQNFTEKISSNCKIRFDLQIPKDCPFTEKVETGLFRILVELINNSVKYSSATEIAIKHSEISNTVCIGYFENGVGFDVAEALNHRTGMGLYNIHSRVDSLGGLMEYYSSPGKGVSVKITFIRKHIYKQPVES